MMILFILSLIVVFVLGALAGMYYIGIILRAFTNINEEQFLEFVVENALKSKKIES